MKVQVFYDANGEVQSVVALERKAQMTPTSPEYSSIEVDLKALKIDSLAAIHSRYRVEQGCLLLRDTPKDRRRAKAHRPDAGV